MGIASVVGLGGGGEPTEFGRWEVVSSREMTGTVNGMANFDVSDLASARDPFFVVAAVSARAASSSTLTLTAGRVYFSGAAMYINSVEGTAIKYTPGGDQGNSASAALSVSGNSIRAQIATVGYASADDVYGVLYVLKSKS